MSFRVGTNSCGRSCGRRAHRRGGTRRAVRRGAVLVIVMAAIVLLAVTVSLVTRRVILSRRAIDSTAAVAQAESAWVTAAEIARHSGAISELRFELPPRGTRTRRAIAEMRDGESDAWVIEVRVEENGRVIARRRGTISVSELGESQ
ncbi:hypothetical protein [Candidatus Laterigemmans baculatus]|uniref:hypothetical protein n=1 Tax=Candidatus Laterigemmans baculatus TaxID=2770505 RepID=UPI0013DC0962|nr:hypothetical protein [Candidatus Laterigemmans baculatus]